jgi:hypothetical protein
LAFWRKFLNWLNLAWKIELAYPANEDGRRNIENVTRAAIANARFVDYATILAAESAVRIACTYVNLEGRR